MPTILPAFPLSGGIGSDDVLHAVTDDPATIIAPRKIPIPGTNPVLYVPQYAPTVKDTSIKYDPAGNCGGYFTSSHFKQNNNCYAYACNIASNTRPQPGRFHGILLPPVTNPRTGPFTGPSVMNGATADGLAQVGGPELKPADLADYKGSHPNGHFVALLIAPSDASVNFPDGDYHFVRCDDNIGFQSWPQKDGNEPVTNYDFAGKPIVNPGQSNWAYNWGPMDADNEIIISYELYAYLFVPWGAVDIL